MSMLAVALVLGLLPGFAWLVFYLSEDTHPEPKRMILLTFFSGVAFGFFTVAIEETLNGSFAQVGIETLSLLSLIGLAFVEEFMKFGAAYFAVGKSEVLNDPVDRMIYMVVAALGFATLENIGAIANIPTQVAAIGIFFETTSLRFVGATLLHTLTSGILGYYWAKGVVHGKIIRNLAVGFLIATLLHAAFNYLILNYGNIAYSIVFLVIVGFFVLNDFEKLKPQVAQ